MSSGQHSGHTEDGTVARGSSSSSAGNLITDYTDFSSRAWLFSSANYRLAPLRALMEIVYFTFHVFSYTHSELLLSILQNIFKNDPI